MVVDRFEIVEPRGVRRHEVGERLRDVVIELCAAARIAAVFIEIQTVKFRIGEKIPVVAEPVEISAEPKEAVARHGFKRLFRERSAARRGEHFGGCPVRRGDVRIIDVLRGALFPEQPGNAEGKFRACYIFTLRFRQSLKHRFNGLGIEKRVQRGL